MIVLIIFFIIILISIYLFYEDHILKTTRYEINNKKIPNEFNNYKIVHISDFHNERSVILNKSLVNKIKQECPNVIVITGDFIDSYRTVINRSISLVKEIVEVAPIYYVAGNHESRIREYRIFEQELKKIGVNILNNEYLTIKKGTSEIELIGIKDPSFISNYWDRYKKIIKRHIDKLDYNRELFTILLIHRPELFDLYVEENINLIFTGHAHGGQVRIPFIGGVLAPNQGFFPKYTQGTHKKNNTTMVISRGIGNSKFPFRVNNRPELVITTLNKTKAPTK